MVNPSAASEVDEGVWRAIAGASIQIPSENSYVYYFPQGHLEHVCFSDSANHDISLQCPLILSKVLSVRFLCSPSSDQVFARILLRPLDSHANDVVNNGGGNDDDKPNDVISFAKILTPSDANNGGGFSVPRFCADSIFPLLDFMADPPVQNLVMKDARNIAWEFRHIYRGTPRRHLLTTGWSKFVNGKRLVAGDSAVFMRKQSTAELFIGIRRAIRFGDYSVWDSVENSTINNSHDALEAIDNAAKGMTFEVVYHPKDGLPDFVVSAEKVDDAMRIHWKAGMRVKMAVEAEDSSRLTCFLGTITDAAIPDTGPWRGSPWRMITVSWDEHEFSPNMNRLSPWHVEQAPHSSQIHSPFPPAKKYKVMQNPQMLLDEELKFYDPMAELVHSTRENLDAVLFNNSTIPASIQGARRDEIFITGRSCPQSNKSHRTFTELLNNVMDTEPKTISTIIPTLDNSSTKGDASSFQLQCSLTTSKPSSITLFGKVIEIFEPFLSYVASLFQAIQEGLST